MIIKLHPNQNVLTLLIKDAPLLQARLHREGLWGKKGSTLWSWGSRSSTDLEMEVKVKHGGSAGGTVQLWTGVQEIENCKLPPEK